jgi:carbon monoxide dehydrogenase subunit G
VSEVRKTLLDVERIAPCMPGATVERVDGDEVAGRVRVKVRPVTASYAGTARFVTKDEAAHRFVLEDNGRETRGTGTASATVEVSMSEQDAVTRVRVVTSLEVTGKQTQFGRGVMSDIAAKLTDQFAACLAERVRGPAPVPDGATPAQAPAATTTPEPENTAAPQTAAAESLDLVSAVAMPVLKRLGPVLGGLAFGLVLGPAPGPSPPDRDHDRGGAGLVAARANRALDRGVTPRRCARC